jgi:phage antirepressor YoqD-like protein
MRNNDENLVQKFQYNGSEITFETGNGVMVNATEMAKPFGKRPIDWLRMPSTIAFLRALREVRFPHITPEESTGMIRTSKGNFSDGEEQGTWMHEDVALEFARWLSSVFAIWCNDRIKELVKHGVTTLTSPSRKQLAEWVIQQEEEIERLKIVSAGKDKTIKELSPKAELMDRVLDAEELIDIGQAAKILDLPFGRNTLFKALREKGVFFKNKNEPKQEYVDRKYFTIKEKLIERSGYNDFIVLKILVTQKGLQFLSMLFNPRQDQKKIASIQ